jgi:dTDP-4-amino-4,6-dideoxygalactose transaminase
MIQCSNPLAGYLSCKEEIDQAVLKVLSNGKYILGDEVKGFENEFASYIGSKYAIGVSNGTEALHLALRALDIGIGDEVITVSHTAVATVAAIVQSGAIPVFVDIDQDTFTIDVSGIEKVITKKTKAIIVVHLYGQPCEMTSIIEMAERFNIRIIEDCAQAHGAAYFGKRVGSLGDIGCFSFYPTKNLGGIGDGGIITTSDDAIAEKLKTLREYGWKDRYISLIHGYNSRLDELQAAILKVKLKYLDKNNKRRNEIAEKYKSGLNGTNLILPVTKSEFHHAFHLYVVKSSRRDELREFLKANNIMTLVHYPVPVHLQPAYKEYYGGPITNTEKLSGEILSLPMYPELSEAEIDYIIDTINRF